LYVRHVVRRAGRHAAARREPRQRARRGLRRPGPGHLPVPRCLALGGDDDRGPPARLRPRERHPLLLLPRPPRPHRRGHPRDGRALGRLGPDRLADHRHRRLGRRRLHRRGLADEVRHHPQLHAVRLVPLRVRSDHHPHRRHGTDQRLRPQAGRGRFRRTTIAAMESWTAPDVPSLPGHGPALRLHDTATGEVRETVPSDGERASMYVCGITPYDATHLGHAATMITFDLVHRYWRDQGLEVEYVQNVTDVDEPLFERAERDGTDWQVLGLRETALYREDMES